MNPMAGLTAWSASDVTSPLIGYREWLLIGDELLSPLARTVWGAEPLHAECLPSCRTAGNLWREPEEHSGPAPDPGCVCGIYALFTPRRPRGRERLMVVRGAVALWGRIELHRRGMRAEYARIVTLALPRARRYQAGVLRTAALLGVEAVPEQALQAAALAHGRPLDTSLIPT